MLQTRDDGGWFREAAVEEVRSGQTLYYIEGRDSRCAGDWIRSMRDREVSRIQAFKIFGLSN